MAELAKKYDPKEVEEKWYKQWMDDGRFHGDSADGGDPFCIVIPPPNVTGILHMGHALNNNIQDILTRVARMQGKNTVWVPGTDHAGIATQNVVERALKKEGKTRDDIGREAFLERVWDWKEEYGSTISNQLKKLGASCDWERERFTMDDGLSDAVQEIFCRLYDKDLIYRGNRIINWCPRCETALSDEESEHVDVEGALYHLRYTVKDKKQKIVVATTRPETMLGDTAVAVNPRDERYKDLIGQMVVLPITNREIPIIADDYVDPEFGTGLVKITPAHDPNDFEMGQRHDLEQINVMTDTGIMNENAGPYEGMDRFECRKQLMEDLKAGGLVEKVDVHQHAVGHCYRCDTVVEPRLSPQWFVKMKSLARPAIEAVNDGKIKFVPERWNKTYMGWMENIRDWCISRQIWWGHRIPIFYCDGCGHEWASKTTETACPKCESSNVRQDEDVLDTWFSSWLWPFSVFGWPEKSDDLNFYYPSKTLVTGNEIIFFWVARMIMSGLEVMDNIPFDTVYIHGTVRDDQGRKMSKSLGNSIDPLDIIEKYSSDALRFSLMMITATGQDVYINDEKFEIGRNFGTKIWNAARFMEMHSADFDVKDLAFNEADLTPDDQHLLAKLNEAIASVNDNLGRYRFNDATLALYDFFWHSYCDWYLEYAKPILYKGTPEQKKHTLQVMHFSFSTALRLLHPFMPFQTEELWHGMDYNHEDESIMVAPWPEKNVVSGISPAVVKYVDGKHDLIRIGRILRAEYELANKQTAKFCVRASNEEVAGQINADLASIMAALNAEEINVDVEFTPEGAMPSGISTLGTVYMSIEGLVDVDAEIKKLTAELDEVNGFIASVKQKLSNENFVNRAPKEVVAVQVKRQEELLEKADKLQKMIETMKG
ncbi:valine--tRNA ligase [Pontiellaceae bacterium B12227]|nr:valine--tRNA ligase [Pontiellaceae bacterium B12227]